MYLLLKRSPSGIAKGWPPFAGVAGVSPASSPLRAACGGAQKREKECFGDTPITCASSSPYYLPPRQGARQRAAALCTPAFGTFALKVQDDSCGEIRMKSYKHVGII